MEVAEQLAAWGVTLLPDWRLLEVHGEDARAWLQGQISQDIGRLNDDHAQYGFATDAKGRILSDLWFFTDAHSPTSVFLSIPAQAVQTLCETWEARIVMEDVALRLDAERSLVTAQALSYSVSTATQSVAAGITTLVEGQAGLQPAALSAACPRLGCAGRDLWLPKPCAAKLKHTLCDALQGGARLLDEASWQQAEMALGRPRYGLDFDHRDHPQETGMARLAVSFSKGCYVGQEAVSMIEHRGERRKQLVRVRLTSIPQGVGAGLELACGGSSIGRVTRCLAQPDGSAWAFAYAKRGSYDAGSPVTLTFEDRPVAEGIMDQRIEDLVAQLVR